MKRRSRVFNDWALCFAVSALATLLVGSCKAQTTIGLHVATAHVADSAHTSTPGLYVVLPFGLADGRVMFGGYRNSLNTPERRASYYVAQVWEWGRWGVMVGVVSGYQQEQSSCGTHCVAKWGHTKGAMGPMAALSMSFPEARRYIGVVPRLSLIPGGLHLSLEWSTQ